MDPHGHSRRFVVETVDEQPDVVPTPSVKRQEWKPGELNSSLKQKIGNTKPPKMVTTDLPKFFQNNRPEEQAADLIKLSSLTNAVKDRLNDMQSIVMSIPAFVTVAVFLCAVSFFAGRFSSGEAKQIKAEESKIATVPSDTLSKQDSDVVPGTPDEIIKSVRDEFSKVLDLAKKPDETTSEKEQASKSILHVLDLLTKGINAYPDVSSLYFERAQIEKLVMQSAPTLKSQSEVDYQKAIELSPLSAAYYIGFADYFDVLTKNELSIENYEKAIRLEPKNLEALYPLAKLYKTVGRLDEARVLYAKILTLIPSSSTQYSQIQKEAEVLIPQPVASGSATPAQN